MLDNKKISAFISEKRRHMGLTQQQVAERLNVSFQAVSKWENGTTYPNPELLFNLSRLLNVSVDELLCGQDSASSGLTYSKAGIDIAYTDAIKKEMSHFIDAANPRVLNGLGPFASLYDIKFEDIINPVLVLKAEEPGSKQKLAMKYGYTESICHDMINHLVNDIVVMGAKPLAVLDTIICGNAEKDTIKSIVKGISDACKENECSLVGGETSIQPNVVDNGVYVLTSSIAGIVDKGSIIDGANISEGDIILAVASNGLHTNGYTLVRMLIDDMPQIKNEMIGNETFIEAIMKPHTPYYKAIKDTFASGYIKGMAHITGGGIESNLSRIIPNNLCAIIDLAKIKTLPIFRYIKAIGNISDKEMLNTFNCGVGLSIIIKEEGLNYITTHISKYYDCYEVGIISTNDIKIQLQNKLNW